jgi:hypothetical protein
MMGFYDAIDLLWDDNEDLQADEVGDLGTTEDDALLAKIQQLRSIVVASVGDWASDPAFAADLHDFVGQPNTRDIGLAIESRIRGAILNNYVALADDVYIRVVPVRHDIVLIILVLDVVATNDNRMEGSGDTSMAFMLNLPSGDMVSISSNKVMNYFPVTN